MGKLVSLAAFVAGIVYCATFWIGCSPETGASATGGGGGGEGTPPDAVRLDGVTYMRDVYGREGEITVASVDRRAAVGRVESEVASYELRDGQANYLRPGTRLYAVRDYDPSFRLAARKGGKDGSGNRWTLYEVWSNPRAGSAAELLDVRGEVERVGLKTFASDGEVASVEGAEAIVDAALDAPLRSVSGSSVNHLLVFHLRDGTRSIRVYDPRSGELYLGDKPGEGESSTGVVLPEEVRQTLRQALRDSSE